MLTPLEIENKKFSKQMMNGYSVEEVDDFLDILTLDYGKLYKEVTELKKELEDMEQNVSHYKTIEGTLQNTLVMAQTTAEDIKKIAAQQAEQIIKDAEITAKEAISSINAQKIEEGRKLQELKKQFDVYKAKMEALLIAQLELLKDVEPDYKLPEEYTEEQEVEPIIPQRMKEQPEEQEIKPLFQEQPKQEPQPKPQFEEPGYKLDHADFLNFVGNEPKIEFEPDNEVIKLEPESQNTINSFSSTFNQGSNFNQNSNFNQDSDTKRFGIENV